MSALKQFAHILRQRTSVAEKAELARQFETLLRKLMNSSAEPRQKAWDAVQFASAFYTLATSSWTQFREFEKSQSFPGQVALLFMTIGFGFKALSVARMVYNTNIHDLLPEHYSVLGAIFMRFRRLGFEKEAHECARVGLGKEGLAPIDRGLLLVIKANLFAKGGDVMGAESVIRKIHEFIAAHEDLALGEPMQMSRIFRGLADAEKALGWKDDAETHYSAAQVLATISGSDDQVMKARARPRMS